MSLFDLMQPEMNFYWWREKGKIVVQNAIMGMMGQKHTHTEADFERWSKDIPPKNLIEIKAN